MRLSVPKGCSAAHRRWLIRFEIGPDADLHPFERLLEQVAGDEEAACGRAARLERAP